MQVFKIDYSKANMHWQAVIDLNSGWRWIASDVKKGTLEKKI